jgi:hypothetical protein
MEVAESLACAAAILSDAGQIDRANWRTYPQRTGNRTNRRRTTLSVEQPQGAWPPGSPVPTNLPTPPRGYRAGPARPGWDRMTGKAPSALFPPLENPTTPRGLSPRPGGHGTHRRGSLRCDGPSKIGGGKVSDFKWLSETGGWTRGLDRLSPASFSVPPGPPAMGLVSKADLE